MHKYYRHFGTGYLFIRIHGSDFHYISSDGKVNSYNTEPDRDKASFSVASNPIEILQGQPLNLLSEKASAYLREFLKSFI